MKDNAKNEKELEKKSSEIKESPKTNLVNPPKNSIKK